MAVLGALAAWLWQRYRAQEDELGREGGYDQQAVLELAITHAKGLLDAQIQDFDELAGKSLGVASFDGIVLALLVGARDDLCSYWWVPAGVLILAGLTLFASVWPQQEIDSGPDPIPFYERFGAELRLFAGEQLLAHLVEAYDKNSPRLARRNLFFNWGCAFLLLGLAASLTIVFLS